jgi:high-affinity nickel-transport protein
VVAATAGALEKRFDGFSNVGGIIGTSVSAAFLILLGIGNAWILVILIKRLRKVLADPDESSEDAAPGLNLEGGGFLVRIFKRVFKLIDRPWKMYPLGILFGMGFDTSSEIAVLGIASIEGAKGTSLWLILIFPVLFTGKLNISLSDVDLRRDWGVLC